MPFNRTTVELKVLFRIHIMVKSKPLIELSHILVAEVNQEVNQQVVGCIQFNHREEKEHLVVVPRSDAFVSSLIVKEEYHRQGISKALMQRVHEWAEEHNIDDIELHVYEFNTPAQGFYEKLGYQTISRRTKRGK